MSVETARSLLVQCTYALGEAKLNTEYIIEEFKKTNQPEKITLFDGDIELFDDLRSKIFKFLFDGKEFNPEKNTGQLVNLGGKNV